MKIPSSQMWKSNDHTQVWGMFLSHTPAIRRKKNLHQIGLQKI